jgi:hypothetical protein
MEAGHPTDQVEPSIAGLQIRSVAVQRMKSTSLCRDASRSDRCGKLNSLIGPPGGEGAKITGLRSFGLLGDPGTVGAGRHAAEVCPPGIQLDEEQHIQPPQPDDVDGDEVTSDDPRLPAGARTPATRCLPGVVPDRARGGAAWYGPPWPIPARQAAGVALDALVAPARVLRGQADDQLLRAVVQRWSAGLAARVRSKRRRPVGGARAAGCQACRRSRANRSWAGRP